jgi:hypothetical protein
MLLGEEEDTMADIAASGDGTQRGGTIETPIDATPTMTTQCSWLRRSVWFVLRPDQFPDLAHLPPFV